MKHTKILIALLLSIATITLIIGCPSADTDSASSGSGITQDEYYFYTDKSGKGQSSNGDFTLYGAYIVEKSDPEILTLNSSTGNGGADGTATYSKLVSNEDSGVSWGGGGWGQPDKSTNTVDLSKYDTLVFWAKSATDTQIKFSIKDAGDTTSPEVPTTITTAWAKYEISFEDLKVTDASKVTVLSYLLVDRDTATPGLQAAVDLDEIYVYKKLDTTAPTITTTGHTAEDGASLIKIKFSESITLADGSKTTTSAPAGITVTSGATGSLVANAVTAAAITGSELTLALTTALVATEKVKVTFDADTIIDTSGNKLAAADTGEITVITPITQDEYYFYTDKSEKTSNNDFELNGGYEGTMTSVDKTTGGADSTTMYLELTGASKSWAAAGWGLLTGKTSADLSEYDTLVFWAKAATTTTIKFGIVEGNDPTDGQPSPLVPEIASADITSTWKKYEISFEDLKVVDASKVKVLKYILANTSDQVDLDEVYVYKQTDTTAPTLATTGHIAEGGTSTVQISFSENITFADGTKSTTSAPAGITVTSGATGSLVANAVTAASITGSELTLTLTTALVAAEKVKVAFTADAIIDTSDNKLAVTDTGEITISTPKTATGLTTPDGFEIWVPTGGTSPTSYVTSVPEITYNDSSTAKATNFAGLFVSTVEPSALLTPNTNNISLVAGSNAGTADLTFSVVGTTVASTTKVKARVIAADTSSTQYWFWGAMLDVSGIFYTGYNKTQTYEFTGSTSDNSQVMKITDNNNESWSAGGFQLHANLLDISNYTYLIVKAKDPETTGKTAALNLLLKFNAAESQGTEESVPITDYDSSGTKNAQALTSVFQVYKIPVVDLAGSQDKTKLSIINLEFAYETTDVKDYEVAISELYFE